MKCVREGSSFKAPANCFDGDRAFKECLIFYSKAGEPKRREDLSMRRTARPLAGDFETAE